MLHLVAAYAASAIVLLALDFVWLSYAVPAFYRPQLGALLSESPNLAVAAGFYLVYAVGIVALAAVPADEHQSWAEALWRGALLGLVAYGTYDATNLATVRGWPAIVSVVDVAWGVTVTTAAALAGYLALRLVP